MPAVVPDRSHVYHLHTIRPPRPDALAAHFNANGVQTAINFPTALPPSRLTEFTVTGDGNS